MKKPTPVGSLAGIPNSSTARPLPQIPLDIGSPANCQYPEEKPDDFNYRIIQRDNRGRRIANGGV